MQPSSRIALVVDDSAAMRRHLAEALERLGVSSAEAADGAEAWRKLASGSYDLIVTDINMPVLDGLKLIGLVRAGGPHQRTPVLVITTESAEADRRRATSLGANAYLVKPVQSQQVAAAIRTLLGGA